MAKVSITRFAERAPALPRRYRDVHHEGDGKIELVVTASDLNGVVTYGFSYNGVAVPTSDGRGTFYAIPGQKKLLEWVMEGDAGGTMKVVVTRGATVVAQRDRSMLPYDAFEIEVS